MQTLTTALTTHLQQSLTTLAACVSIARADGGVLTLTDHDQSFRVNGALYGAEPGLLPTRIGHALALGEGRNALLELSLHEGGVTAADIALGRYDRAEICIFLVNYDAPDDGQLQLFYGRVARVSQQGQRCGLEVEPLDAALENQAMQRFSPSCRAQLGDARCGVNLAAHQVSGTLFGADGSHTILDNARAEAVDYFAGGTITFTNGALQGLSFPVRGNSTGRIDLLLPLAVLPSNGTAYQLARGCDKSLSMCRTRFSNALNFRGEPHLPGIDRLLQTPRALVDAPIR